MNENLVPDFVLVKDPAELYTGSSMVILDFETDIADKGSPLNPDNDIVCACWLVVDEDGFITKRGEILGGIYDMGPLLDDVMQTGYVVAMNAKFELGWLKRCGVELRDIFVYDPMLAQWVLDGNRSLPRSLNGMAKRYGTATKLDFVGNMLDAGVSTRDIKTEWLLSYCHQDVEVLRQILYKQWKEVSKRDVWHLVHVRNLTCAVLADIEFEGMTLDPVKVEAAYNKAVNDLEELGAKLAEMTGGINLGSPKQLSTYLYTTLGMEEPKDYKGDYIRTPSGEPTANSKALAMLKPQTEEQVRFLTLYKEYNKTASLLEKNLEYFKLTCDQRGGKFHGQFKQNVVDTHRLASGGIPILFKGKKKTKSVQLQNIPREFKSLFVSGDDDWVVMEVDGSQLEFRVAIDMGHDTVGLKEIESGVDVHKFTAEELDKHGDPLITSFEKFKDKRQHSKQYTFKPLYGGGKGSPAVEAYCEYFKNKYVELSAVQRSWALTTADKGWYTTPYGMTFYFPDTKVQRSGYITNTTNIYNYPVQGFATGEIIPIALIYFWHKTRNLALRIFSTIHDSIVSKARKDCVEEAIAIAKECLTLDVYKFLEVVYGYKFVVPLGLGVKAGSCWGDDKAKEYKWDIWPDGKEIMRE